MEIFMHFFRIFRIIFNFSWLTLVFGIFELTFFRNRYKTLFDFLAE